MVGHESLIAWQHARQFVLDSFRMTCMVWKPEVAAAIDQLRRSTLSVQLNIAEGYAVKSDGRFRHHLTTAYGSAVEAVDVVGLLAELMPEHRVVLMRLLDQGRQCCALVLALKKAVDRRIQK